MAYTVTAADMIERYDERTLGDLCSDDGTGLTGSYLTDSTKMATAISSATGQVKASLLKANRYTADQLDALEDDGLAYLKDLTCAIAWWFLWRRRPAESTEAEQRKEARETAETYLDQLRKGIITLDVAAAQEAGEPDVVASDVTTLSTRGYFSWAPRGRYYPTPRTP